MSYICSLMTRQHEVTSVFWIRVVLRFASPFALIERGFAQFDCLLCFGFLRKLSEENSLSENSQRTLRCYLLQLAHLLSFVSHSLPTLSLFKMFFWFERHIFVLEVCFYDANLCCAYGWCQYASTRESLSFSARAKRPLTSYKLREERTN